MLLACELGEAGLTDVEIGFGLGLESPVTSRYLITADVAVYCVFPVYVVFTQLISKRKPAFSKIVVSSEQLNFLRFWDEQINKTVDLVWFLGLLADFSHYQVI